VKKSRLKAPSPLVILNPSLQVKIPIADEMARTFRSILSRKLNPTVKMTKKISRSKRTLPIRPLMPMPTKEEKKEPRMSSSSHF